MNLHQLPTFRIARPETIAETFTIWSALLAFENAADDDATCQALSEARAQIERLAMTLPTPTALDVWRLIVITTDKPDEDRIEYTADAVIVRAHREVDGDTEGPRFDQAACLVDAVTGR